MWLLDAPASPCEACTTRLHHHGINNRFRTVKPFRQKRASGPWVVIGQTCGRSAVRITQRAQTSTSPRQVRRELRGGRCVTTFCIFRSDASLGHRPDACKEHDGPGRNRQHEVAQIRHKGHHANVKFEICAPNLARREGDKEGPPPAAARLFPLHCERLPRQKVRG